MKDEGRLYPIKPDEGHFFYAGFVPNGEQVLMGLACPDLVAFFFDRAGHLLRVEKRPLSFMQEGQPPYSIYDERIPKRIDAWQREMRFQPATINIKQFFCKEEGIGIQVYPDHFQEILADPEASEAEKEDVRDSMRLWDKDGQFVLWWGNDYWLDGTGSVVSS